MIRLNVNESPWCSKKVLQRLKNITKEDICRYPSYEGLNKKIADYCNVKSKNILVTNASDDGLQFLIDSFVNPGDKVAIFKPTFGMYEFFLKKRIGILLYNFYIYFLDLNTKK